MRMEAEEKYRVRKGWTVEEFEEMKKKYRESRAEKARTKQEERKRKEEKEAEEAEEARQRSLWWEEAGEAPAGLLTFIDLERRREYVKEFAEEMHKWKEEKEKKEKEDEKKDRLRP